jgi:hypothetical protein
MAGGETGGGGGLGSVMPWNIGDTLIKAQNRKVADTDAS